MASEPVLLQAAVEPASIPLPKSPIVRVNSQPLPTDSMISIDLSPPVTETNPGDEMETASTESDATVEPIRTSNRRSSAEIFSGVDLDTEINGSHEEQHNESVIVESPQEVDQDEVEAAAAALEGRPRSRRVTNGSSDESEGSVDDEIPVDWEELEKNEELEPRDEASDEVRTLRYGLCILITD